MGNLIKPYGDTLNDGVMQLSFTLPVELSAKAKKAAEVYLEKLNSNFLCRKINRRLYLFCRLCQGPANS